MSKIAIRVCFIFLLVLLAVANTANATDKTSSGYCFGTLRAALSVGGYTGGLDCSTVHVKMRKAGMITILSDKYTVYDLRYQTIPVDGTAVHGGQRIIIILNGKTYLGQYSLDTPPFHKISVKGHSIFINVSAEHGNRIKIGKNGPPSKVFLDQNVKEFYK